MAERVDRDELIRLVSQRDGKTTKPRELTPDERKQFFLLK
jgi:hypothetical protein